VSLVGARHRRWITAAAVIGLRRISEPAAGVLLNVTATGGSLCYAGWAYADRVLAGRLAVSPEVTVAPTRA
jgi:hypothetical protein